MDEQDLLQSLAVELLDKRHHVPANQAADKIDDRSGLYAILALEGCGIPAPFSDYLAKKQHLCLYVGKAMDGSRRLVRYDLNGGGPSTFFCSLGLVLGYSPVPGSLLGKKDQDNFKFSTEDTNRLASWSSAHLAVAWRPLEKGIVDALEGPLIQVIKPLLNLNYNPEKLTELEELRRQARERARKPT